MTGVPYAEGSVSLGLYVHDLPGEAMVQVMLDQAGTAAKAGFDGVTMSEHHLGYPGYVPDPVLVTGWLLDAMPAGWAGPLPVLLPLRSAGLVAEQLAWLALRFPGRVGAGFASGYQVQDFTAAGVDFEGRNPRFREQLRRLAAVLGTADSPPTEPDFLAADVAVRSVAGSIPLVVAALGPRAVALAAQLGMGLCVPSHDDAGCAAVYDAYDGAGGRGPRVVLRWVWLGEPPRDAIRQWGLAHAAHAGDRSWANDAEEFPELRVVAHRDPQAVAEELHRTLRASRATCLSLRIHLPTLAPEVVSEQITAIGTEVLPRLRAMQDA